MRCDKMHKLLVLLFLTAASFSLSAQDLFDEEHTLQYGSYLYQRGNYELAIPEFERLVYFNPGRQSYKLHLLDTYFQSQAYDEIEQSVNRWSPDQVDYPVSLFYLKAQIKKENFEEALRILKQNSRFYFPSEKKAAYEVVSYGLAGKWDQASTICKNERPQNTATSFEEYCSIVTSATQFKQKNRIVAAGLSAVVPGMGKVYTRDYADAAANLIFIGLTAFQAYRGFTNESINDLQGWIYGGVALSFYLGNIYGSWRAADQYNYRFYENKREALDHTFFRIERYTGEISKP